MKKRLLEILSRVQEGKITVEEALLEIRIAPYEDIGYAKLDHHREIRQGYAEVIYGASKTPSQILGIVTAMQKAKRPVLITKMTVEAAQLLTPIKGFKYHKVPSIGVIGEIPTPSGEGKILVVTAGTSDIPIAEEAAVTAEVFGNKVERIYDVGVAGLHRLLSNLESIMSASVIIAVAGMEGALASVLGGLANCPVIGVPTSVGYGASFHGVAALLSMLNSCAAGVSVVNIDNGFGAAYLASMINEIR